MYTYLGIYIYIYYTGKHIHIYIYVDYISPYKLLLRGQVLLPNRLPIVTRRTKNQCMGFQPNILGDHGDPLKFMGRTNINHQQPPTTTMNEGSFEVKKLKSEV